MTEKEAIEILVKITGYHTIILSHCSKALALMLTDNEKKNIAYCADEIGKLTEKFIEAVKDANEDQI